MADLIQPIATRNLLADLTQDLPDICEGADTTPNDSNKTITVPTDEAWQIIAIRATLQTTATVGNRHIRLYVNTPSSYLIYTHYALNVQTASTAEIYMMLPGYGAAIEPIATQHYIPLPSPCLLAPGSTITIIDQSAIDPAADDLTIHHTYRRYQLSQTP